MIVLWMLLTIILTIALGASTNLNGTSCIIGGTVLAAFCTVVYEIVR